MTGKLNKFYVGDGINRARIMASSRQLTPGCIAAEEIDTNIQALKDDLDLWAKEMKRLAHARGNLFRD